MITAATDPTPRPSLRRLGALISSALLAVLLMGMLAASASAEFGLDYVDGESTRNEAGDAAVQAGSHPWKSNVQMGFNFYEEEGFQIPYAQFKDIQTILPPGQVGTPLATPRCSRPVFQNSAGEEYVECPNNTAVGWAKVKPNWVPYYLYAPVFNLEPERGEPALFGFRILTATIFIHARVRSGANAGVTLESRESSQGLPITDTEVTLWGVPADPIHDKERGRCMERGGPTGDICTSNVPPKPLINFPTACSPPIETTIRSNPWTGPNFWSEGSFLSHGADGVPVAIEGCEKLGFEPRMTFAMEPSTAASPGSLDVTMAVPQNGGPEGLVSAHLKKVTTTLPEGVTLNTSSADGISSCSLEQIGLNEGAPSECPESSRIGTVRIKTPLLEDELGGSLFLAEQNRNPFNSLIALYLAIENEKNGVYVKTAGKVDLDPVTGRLTTTFDGQPQLPFNEFELSFAGGPRAALATPSTCGTYKASYSLESWSGKTVNGSSQVKVDQDCGKETRFTPWFDAGTANPVAGEHSPFTMRVTREDGQQNIAAIDVKLPQGLTAKLAGVPLCGDAAAAAGTCPATSQIGTTTVASGVGTNPVFIPQPGKAPTAIYLAGPYKGAPYSLVVKVPAQAGAFDLGVVSVRSPIRLDPVTTEVTVKSDPLPQILQGVPVRYRDIRVDVNRPNFTLNPTSCEPKSIDAAIGSDMGATAAVSSRFQVTDCAALAFKPKLALSLKGGTKRGDFPALKAVMTQPKGQANIGKVSVALPHSEFLEQAHIRTICTRVQYSANNCPKAAIYGKARAFTPLLDKPLEGPVYLRSSNNPLPDLVASLDGPVHVDLSGRIDSVNGGIRSTFSSVPDAPVTKFVLEMQGGKKGLLVNSRDICNRTYRATVKMDGQNGKVHDFRPVLSSKCGKKTKKK